MPFTTLANDAARNARRGHHRTGCSLHVLVLHSEVGVLRGGGENFTKNLFTAFAARGHRVTAAFAADRDAHYPLPLPACIEPIPVCGWWSRQPGQAVLSYLSANIGPPSVRRLCGRIREAVSWRTIRWHNRRFERRVQDTMVGRWDQFDAVYVHGDASLAHAVAQRRPTVLRLPGPVAHDFAPLLHDVHVVCANGDALSRLRAVLGDRAVELPVGVDEQRFHAGPSTLRARLGWTADHVVIGYVGRLAHVKGVDLLAAAFRAISGAAPAARLLIVGTGEEEAGLRAVLAGELARGVAHIEPDVDHQQLAQWYRAMDVLVMPSRYENFSNAVVEAMACGVPFVASDVGGNRSLAESGAGWLFERESIASLQAVLAGIAANRAGARARGLAAARHVRARYSWQMSAERLEQIMRSLGGEAS